MTEPHSFSFSDFNRAALSTESLWALELVAIPLALHDRTMAEVSATLGVPGKVIRARVSKLRRELGSR